MDGWVDGWMDGWMGGWMGGWMDRWTDRWKRRLQKNSATIIHGQTKTGSHHHGHPLNTPLVACCSICVADDDGVASAMQMENRRQNFTEPCRLHHKVY